MFLDHEKGTTLRVFPPGGFRGAAEAPFAAVFFQRCHHFILPPHGFEQGAQSLATCWDCPRLDLRWLFALHRPFVSARLVPFQLFGAIPMNEKAHHLDAEWARTIGKSSWNGTNGSDQRDRDSAR